MRTRECRSTPGHAVCVVLLLAACSSYAPPAHGQLVQQGPKLLGTGAIGSAQQGHSAALSADGNTAAFAGTYDGELGAVWVFTRTNGVWSQQGAKLVCPDPGGAEVFGNTLGLSGDGNILIIGHNSGANGAWIFTRSNGAWQFQQKLSAPNGSVNQGAAVAISKDGSTAILGDPLYGNTTINGAGGPSGAGWVFVQNNGTWVFQQRLVGSNMLSPPSQGTSTAISADGNTVVLGGPGDNFPGGSSVGAAWVFTRTGGVWDQGTKLVGKTTDLTRQGSAVAVSGDGSTVLVSGPYGVGGAYVFVRANGAWTQQAGPLAHPNNDKFSGDGVSVAVNADGNVAIIGAPGANLAGLFIRTNGSWLFAQQITGSQTLSYFSQFGYSAAISADTTTVLIGGPGDAPQGSSNLGAMWAFYSPPNSITAAAGTPQLAIVGTRFPSPLEAMVTNTLKYPAPAVNTTFTAPSTGPGGSFQGSTNIASVATNAAGVATAPVFTANATVGGPYTVVASVDGVNLPASFELTNAPPTVQITVQTSPPNLLVSLDSSNFTAAPITQNLVPGSTHTIAAQSPQPASQGAQYVFQAWSDGLALSHSITVPAVDTVYTASFRTSAPTISSGGVVNAATNAAPGPGDGIAPGSIITIYGTGLGPSTAVGASSLPLDRTLANVQVTVTPAKGSALAAYPIYVSASQINAIIPSNVPDGQATITVTFNSIAGQAAPVQIVSASFGIFTGSYGSGAAAAIDVNLPNPYISETNAARPGDVVLLYGTGLGPVSRPDNQAPGAVSPPGINVQVILAGQTIAPTYAGRSPQFPGEDQINFRIPTAALPSTCSLPVSVVVNGTKSNSATLFVAPNGGVCLM